MKYTLQLRLRLRRRAGCVTAAVALQLYTVASAVGCVPTQGRPFFPPPLVSEERTATMPTADQAAVLIARARAYEQATGDFSATVDIVERDISHGGQAFSVRGGIAVRRPEAMRMQVLGPGGITVLDLLARDGSYWTRIGGRSWIRGSLSEPPGGRFPASTIAAAFLGFDWNHAVLVRDGALALARIARPGATILVAFDARDGTTREVRWLSAGVEQARMRFGEFETVTGGARMPRIALFWQNSPNITATMTVEHRVLTPTLPATTFAPP